MARIKNYELSSTVISHVKTLLQEKKIDDAYDYLAEVGKRNIEKYEISSAVLVWLKGAAAVNRGEGASSNFIREYTSTQHFIRKGTYLSEKDLTSVSNEIGVNVLNHVIRTKQLPTLDSIADYDATTAVKLHFSGNAAAWSGNILFLMLGHDNSFSKNLLKSPEGTYDFLTALFSFYKVSGFKTFSIADAAKAFWGSELSLLGTSKLFVNAFADGQAFVQSTYGDKSLTLPAIVKMFAIKDAFLGKITADNFTLDGRNNFVHSGAGDDYIDGKAGDDILDGGTNNDILLGGAGADRLFGGAGIDTASYNLASSGVTVNLANPKLNKGEAVGDIFVDIERIQGSKFADQFVGDDKANEFDGGKGTDTISGGKGADVLYGGDNNDVIVGGSGSDRLYGGFGNDIFRFAPGDLADKEIDGGGISATEANRISGYGILNFSGTAIKAINEIVFEGGGRFQFDAAAFTSSGIVATTRIFGSAGIDEIIFAVGNSKAGGRIDAHQLVLNNWQATDRTSFVGSSYADTIFGTQKSDTINGGKDNDTLDGVGGSDKIYGGDGDDKIYVDLAYKYNADWTVRTYVGKDALVDGGAGIDTLVFKNAQFITESGDGDQVNPLRVFTNFETVRFSAESDYVYFPGLKSGISSPHGLKIYAGAGNDRIFATDGDDFIYGQSGDDNLTGGAGADVIYGGDGNDTLRDTDSFPTMGRAGDNSADRLYGEAGNDSLYSWGGSINYETGTIEGDAYLDGGAGDDILYISGIGTSKGGEGRDIFSVGEQSEVRVIDFKPVDDSIVIETSNFFRKINQVIFGTFSDLSGRKDLREDALYYATDKKVLFDIELDFYTENGEEKMGYALANKLMVLNADAMLTYGDFLIA